MDLKADFLQGVVFFGSIQSEGTALELWKKLFLDHPPEGFQSGSSLPGLQSNASGQIGGYSLTLTLQPGRIDLILRHPIVIGTPAPTPPPIEDVEAATKFLTQLMLQLSSDRILTRAAMVCKLLKPIGQEPEAEVNEIVQHLPAFPFPKNSSDIVVQFNSPKWFAIAPSMQMNRLMTWQKVHLGTVQNVVGAMGGPLTFSPYFEMNIDVNSSPNLQLPPDKVEAVIDELRLEILDLCTNGYDGKSNA